MVLEDHSGAAAVSARVRVRAASGEVVADRDADRTGRFSTPPLAPGRYRLEVSKTNHLPAQVGIAHPAEKVAVRLTRLGVVSGRVLDAAQGPIEQAFVFPLVERGGRLEPLGAVATPASGEYRLHGLRPGRYAVGVSRASYQHRLGSGAMIYPPGGSPEYFEIHGGEEYRNIDFVFPAASLHRITGRVEGADSEKAYSIGLASRDQPLLAVSSAKTDDEGGFVLEGVPSGSYLLYAAGPVGGYGWREAIVGDDALYGRTELDVAGQDVDAGTVAVGPPRVGWVKIEYESDEAARACPPTVRVRLTALEAWGTDHRKAVSASSAEPARVDRIPPGAFRLEATDLPEGCFQTGAAEIDPAAAEPLVVVRLGAAATIAGTVSRANNPSAYLVVLAPADGLVGDASLAASPDMDGRFRFDGLAPGDYRILTRPAGGERRWSVGDDPAFRIEAVGGTTTEIDLPILEAQP